VLYSIPVFLRPMEPGGGNSGATFTLAASLAGLALLAVPSLRTALAVALIAADAARHYHAAIDIFTRIGDLFGQADSLSKLAQIHQATGDAAAARDARQRSERILADLNHPDSERIRARLGTV
jgi:hypothetical protein